MKNVLFGAAAGALLLSIGATPAAAAQEPAPIIVGGYRAANVQDQGVQAAAQAAVTAMNVPGLTLRSVDSAQTQLVQGMNYRLEITTSDGQRSRVTVYRPLRGAMQVGRSERIAAARAAPAIPIVGGYRAVSTSDAGVQAAVAFAIGEMEDEDAELQQIEAAQVQLVQGSNYRVRFVLTDGSRWNATVYRPLRGPMRVTASNQIP
jgi:hypothetical protein